MRAIEIRPGTVKGRKITHHALARLQRTDPVKTEPTIGTSAAPQSDEPGPGLFMEWAVGKQGEVMRPDSGKLMLPKSKIMLDIHYHAVGEDITDNVELGIYLYPKGQEPSTARRCRSSARSPAATATSTSCRIPHTSAPISP